MNFRMMEIFCKVVDRGIMARAADDLDMTPAAISRSITELEEKVGKKLLTRTTRKLSVTPEGQHYYNEARKILETFHSLHNQFEELAGEVTGRLKIAAPMSYGLTVLPQIISDFKRHYPEVIIEIQLQDSLTDLVSEGFDLAIRIQKTMKDSSLIAQKFASFHHHLVASPQFISKHKPIKKPDDLKALPCLSYMNSTNPTKWKFHLKNQTYTHSFKAAVSANNSQFLINLALTGEGICLVPDFLVQDHINNNRLTELLPNYEKPLATGWIVYPSKKFQRPIVEQFIKYINRATSKES